MLKLIKLEIRKFKFKGFIQGAVIANLVILALMFLIVLTDKFEASASFTDYASIFPIIGTFSKVTFAIFAAVLIARMIIGEFNNKTIAVLFMYPINRKKLLVAKLAIIVAFTFVSILLTDLVLGSLFCILNSYYSFISDSLTGVKVTNFLINSVLDAFAYSGVSLIPLYFGMRKKSVSATIIASIVIVTLLSSNNNGFSLSSIIAIPLSFAAIGVIIAYLAIRNIEHKDIDVSN